MTRRLLAATAICLCMAPAAFAQEDTAAAAATPPEAAASPVNAAAAPVAPPEPAPPAPALAAPVAIEPRGNDMSVEYRIGPEDVLDVLVWKNAELSRTVPVRPDGKVSLPLVNDIQASGLTPADLRQQLTVRLAEFVPSPEVSVIVREINAIKVSVVGAVRQPGRYALKSPATVLELLALAQGLTEFANRDKVVVLRNNGTTTQRIPFNYRKVTDGSEQENFFVRPGDIILVP